MDASEARGNVENFVGFAQIPVGIAGPLLVDTSAGRREVFVPMATNEGALVASHARGMRLIAAAGGARARVLREGLSQNPILVYRDAARAQRACETVQGCLEDLRKDRLELDPARAPGRRPAAGARTPAGALAGLHHRGRDRHQHGRARGRRVLARRGRAHRRRGALRTRSGRRKARQLPRPDRGARTFGRLRCRDSAREPDQHRARDPRGDGRHPAHLCRGLRASGNPQLVGPGRQRPGGGDAGLRSRRGLSDGVRQRSARFRPDRRRRSLRQRQPALTPGRHRRRRFAEGHRAGVPGLAGVQRGLARPTHWPRSWGPSSWPGICR